jgi:hypothetical protein
MTASAICSNRAGRVNLPIVIELSRENDLFANIAAQIPVLPAKDNYLIG